jgi:hypothetical protein
MPPSRNLENIRTWKRRGHHVEVIGGDWEDMVVGVHGFNRDGVEWTVIGCDAGIICGGRISGGSRCCTATAVVCTVKTHLTLKAKLKPELMYINTTDTRSRRNTASLAWGVPIHIFGGRVDELGVTMLKTVKFKRFCEILLDQVNEGISAHEVDWYPIVETVMHILECRTPQNLYIIFDSKASERSQKL